MSVSIAPPPGDDTAKLLSQIKDAVRPLPVCVNVEIGDYKGGAWLAVETISLVPVARVPIQNESIVLDDDRRVRVCAPPEHVGASAVLRCRLLSTPVAEDNF